MSFPSQTEAASNRPNVFLALTQELTRLERKANGVRQLVEVSICGCFLDVVLGRDWFTRAVLPASEHDDWTQNRLKHDGVSGIVHCHRVVRLADALFTLFINKVDGFDVLRRRFHTRPTKPCFIETEIASLLTFNGFKVEIMAESGKRGSDFDLAAKKERIELNVEVTGKDELPFTVNTIKNTLKKKRTQTPSDRPAILYMHVPASWMDNLRKAQSQFTEAFTDFFIRSHRLNGIVLVWERVVPFANGGFPQMTMWPCFNNRPRHPFNQWDLVTRGADSEGKPRYALSFYNWLKGVQSKHLTDTR